MVDGIELDRRAREIAKMIDDCPVDDFDSMRTLLAMAEEVRLDFVEWVEENSNV